jgi:hypothetical protein
MPKPLGTARKEKKRKGGGEKNEEEEEENVFCAAIVVVWPRPHSFMLPVSLYCRFSICKQQRQEKFGLGYGLYFAGFLDHKLRVLTTMYKISFIISIQGRSKL